MTRKGLCQLGKAAPKRPAGPSLLAERLCAVLRATQMGAETRHTRVGSEQTQDRQEPKAEGEEKILFELGPTHVLKM